MLLSDHSLWYQTSKHTPRRFSHSKNFWFRVGKNIDGDQTQTTTAIRGTKGYVAPEWFRNQPITVKVELICCRKNFEQNMENENQMILADWAYDCYRDETLHLLVEKDEEALHDMNRVKKYLMIAIWCIQEDPSLRPSMKKVTQMLEEVVQVSTPPDPSSFTSSNYSNWHKYAFTIKLCHILYTLFILCFMPFL